MQLSNCTQIHLSSFEIVICKKWQLRLVKAKRFAVKGIWIQNKTQEKLAEVSLIHEYLNTYISSFYNCSLSYVIHKCLQARNVELIYIFPLRQEWYVVLGVYLILIAPTQGWGNVGPILPHGQNKRPFGHVNRICVL